MKLPRPLWANFRWNIYTCSEYEIVIKTFRKNTVEIDSTPKDYSNRCNRMQPSKIKMINASLKHSHCFAVLSMNDESFYMTE
jgi:hypothetical protein